MSAKSHAFMNRLFYGLDSLTRQLSVAEAEAEFIVKIRGLRKKVPFGFLNPQWTELKAKLAPGDGLWEFKLRGMGIKHRGVKLVRRGKVIECIAAETIELKPRTPSVGRRNSPWKHIESGQYQQAVRSFTYCLRRHKSGPNYANRGIAYLNLGQYDKALADFRTADEVHPSRTDGYLQTMGIAQWLAGRESEATTTWHALVIAHERGKIQYSDGAGGVESPSLLWFAAVRLGRSELLKAARHLLKAKASSKNWRCQSWPAPIAKFLLGRIKEDRLRSQVADVPPLLRARQLCQAEFYIGVRRLQQGDYAGARKAFRTAAKLTEATLADEYYLALHESKRPLRGERRGN
jgi:hypothetical protein